MEQEEIGCEAYLYKDIQCCLNPCSASQCPEPICAIEFPGGINAYLRYKKLQQVLRSGMDLEQAAAYLNVSMYSVRSLFNKGIRVFSMVRLKCR